MILIIYSHTNMRRFQYQQVIVFVFITLLCLTCGPRERIINYISLPLSLELTQDHENRIALGGFMGDVALEYKTTSGSVGRETYIENRTSKGLFTQISLWSLSSLTLSYSRYHYIADFRINIPVKKLRVGCGAGCQYADDFYPFYSFYINYPEKNYNAYLCLRYLNMPNEIRFSSNIRDSFVMNYRSAGYEAGLGTSYKLTKYMSFLNSIRAVYVTNGLKDFDQQGNIIDVKKYLIALNAGICVTF
jgi:hypothetical protein